MNSPDAESEQEQSEPTSPEPEASEPEASEPEESEPTSPEPEQSEPEQSETTPPEPDSKLQQIVKVTVMFLFAGGCGILLALVVKGVYDDWRARQPQAPKEQAETPELPEYQPTPIPEPSIEPPPEPEIPLNEAQPPLKIPTNPSDEQIACLKNGGGATCFEEDYQPNVPESNSPQQSPPNSEDPNEPPEAELDLDNIPIAVISGREVLNWTPDYSLHPMEPGVCPPSWLITYQKQLFCDRRPIFEPPQLDPRFNPRFNPGAQCLRPGCP